MAAKKKPAGKAAKKTGPANGRTTRKVAKAKAERKKTARAPEHKGLDEVRVSLTEKGVRATEEPKHVVLPPVPAEQPGSVTDLLPPVKAEPTTIRANDGDRFTTGEILSAFAVCAVVVGLLLKWWLG